NTSAHWMRSSIQSDMHRDLDNARAFLRQAQSKESAEEQLAETPSVDPESSLPKPVSETISVVVSTSTSKSRWLMRAGVLLVAAGVARASAADRTVAGGSRLAAKPPDQSVIAAAAGMLAVSSPTSVDIYREDTYIGSAPVSIELPAGMYTFEYRHGNFRRQ